MATTTQSSSDRPPGEPIDGLGDGAEAVGGLRIGGTFRISWDRIFTTIPIYVGLIIIWLYFDSQTDGLFIGARNLSEMAQEFSYEAVLAIGVVFVLLLGEIDLSLGYLTLLSVAFTSTFSSLQHWSAGESILAAIVLCTLAGLCQGLLIAWVRMPAFVVTLGGFLIFEGIAYHILAGSTVNVFDPFIISLGTYNLSPVLGWLLAAVLVGFYLASALTRQVSRSRAGLEPESTTKIVVVAAAIIVGLGIAVLTLNSYRGVPMALALLVVLASIFWYFSTHFRFGRHIFAVGGNLEAARRAGINTTAVRWVVFGISGMMAGIAGVMLVGYAEAGSTTTAGPDLLLDVISIAVIGGVSLTGGKGSVWAVLLGGLVIASLDSGLNLMDTDPYYVYIIKGVILLLAIMIDIVGKRWSELPFARLLNQG